MCICVSIYVYVYLYVYMCIHIRVSYTYDKYSICVYTYIVLYDDVQVSLSKYQKETDRRDGYTRRLNETVRCAAPQRIV